MSNVFPFDQHQFNQPLIPEDSLNGDDGDDYIQQEGELPDGSSVYTIGQPEPQEPPQSEDFYENLALNISESKLSVLASQILEDIKADQESREEWEKTGELVYKYMGFKIEEFRNVPFFQACAAFDSTLSSALLNSYATARAELFPASGPARTEILGAPSPEVDDEGTRVKLFMNYYLTTKDRDYYPDSERLLLYVIFYGSAFRKVYQDPIAKEPRCRFIKPQDFIINHHTTSLMASNRLTEVMYLERKDIMLRQQMGDFIESELPAVNDEDEDESRIQQAIKRTEGISTDSTENKSLFKFYEVHTNLDPKDIENLGDGVFIPRPYIVTICATTRKIMSLIRNWKEDDETYKRREFYVHYYYLPGFGIYSLGLAHLCGSNSIVLTSILRQLIDAGTLQNFPGGLMMRGLRLEDNDKAIGPTEFRSIDTGGRALQDCVMQMPYSGPSSGLMQLRDSLKNESSNLIAAAENAVPETGMNMPVGTTLALLEVANKVESSVLRSLHNSLGYELKLLFNLFAEYLPDSPYPFSVPGQETAIMKKDFSDNVNIVPVSDPNVLTTTHRLMRAQALLQLAQGNPDIHDMRQVYYRMYQAMNMDNIDQILPKPSPPPPPQALDPITENMTMLQGTAVTVAMFQDDDAHNIAHRNFLQDPVVQAAIQQNSGLYAMINMHIQAHEANKAYKQLHQQRVEQHAQHQMMMSIQQGMPPEMAQMQMQQHLQNIHPPHVSDDEQQKIPQHPEIQNMVAQQAAQKIIQDAQAQQEQQKQQQEQEQREKEKQEQLSQIPNQIMLQEIQQQREAAMLKEKEAEQKNQLELVKAQMKQASDQEKNQVEIMKANIKHVGDMAKMESQREIAIDKNLVDIAIEDTKHNTQFLE
jgi:hypothetical protein